MSEPFSLQDIVLRERLRQIVREQGIRCVVETGVDKGLSTVEFSKMADYVFAVDNQMPALQTAYDNLGKAGRFLNPNVTLCYGNSPFILWSLQPLLPDETLYFLDAHWQEYWPILDEIRAIRPGTGVIVIHDMVVPDHPELGYDGYNGCNLDYVYVKDVVKKWSPTHRVEYNESTEGTAFPRGCGFFFPK